MKQTFLQKRHTHGQLAHGKGDSDQCHLGNANQKAQTETFSHSSGWLLSEANK
jgi:hypothetical protein